VSAPEPVVRPDWLPERETRAADLIQRVWCSVPGPHWAEDAAVLLLRDGDVGLGLRVLDQLRTEHIPMPRRPGSEDVICAKCRVGWKCDYAVLLEGGAR